MNTDTMTNRRTPAADGGVDQPDRRLAVDRVGRLGSAPATGAGAEDDGVGAAQGRGQLLAAWRRPGPAPGARPRHASRSGACSGGADQPDRLVPALGEQGAEPQPDLSMASGDDGPHGSIVPHRTHVRRREYAGAMTAALQGCALQGSLWDVGDEAGLRGLGGAVRRTVLTAAPGWTCCRAGSNGSDALFGRLLDDVPWRAERRQMYDRVVDVPRLLSCYGEGEPLPDPVLEQAREDLSAHYAGELGEPFVTAGLCLYRDGRGQRRLARRHDRPRPRPGHDGGDPVARRAPRAAAAPARGRRRALRYQLGHGDLVVMGGSCQRTWEHAIPKTARPVGPRISVQFRTRGVR